MTGDLDAELEVVEQMAASWLTLGRMDWAPKTTLRKSTSLKSFARWQKAPAFLANYSLPTPAQPEPHPLPGGLDDVLSMLAAVETEQERALIVLCGMAGLRVSEAIAVTDADFDDTEGTLTVRGKGDRTRIVPVLAPAAAALAPARQAAQANGGALAAMQDRKARYAITRAGERAGIARPVSSHDLRATFATHVYSQTKDLRAVQELLGHANAKTTEVYTGISMATKKAAVATIQAALAA